MQMADNPAWTEMLRNTAPTTPTAALGGTVDRPAAVDMNHVGTQAPIHLATTHNVTCPCAV